METNVLEIQMVTREEVLAKINIFTQLTILLPFLALISVSKEREGDRYIRFMHGVDWACVNARVVS